MAQAGSSSCATKAPYGILIWTSYTDTSLTVTMLHQAHCGQTSVATRPPGRAPGSTTASAPTTTARSTSSFFGLYRCGEEHRLRQRSVPTAGRPGRGRAKPPTPPVQTASPTGAPVTRRRPRPPPLDSLTCPAARPRGATSSTADLVIVGGGPAGSAAAIEAARAEIDAVVIDKGDLPS
ncbi:MAG: NAD(P)-binding protein [Acidimicrobiales bacterium]